MLLPSVLHARKVHGAALWAQLRMPLAHSALPARLVLQSALAWLPCACIVLRARTATRLGPWASKHASRARPAPSDQPGEASPWTTVSHAQPGRTVRWWVPSPQLRARRALLERTVRPLARCQPARARRAQSAPFAPRLAVYLWRTAQSVLPASTALRWAPDRPTRAWRARPEPTVPLLAAVLAHHALLALLAPKQAKQARQAHVKHARWAVGVTNRGPPPACHVPPARAGARLARLSCSSAGYALLAHSRRKAPQRARLALPARLAALPEGHPSRHAPLALLELTRP